MPVGAAIEEKPRKVSFGEREGGDKRFSKSILLDSNESIGQTIAGFYEIQLEIIPLCSQEIFQPLADC